MTVDELPLVLTIPEVAAALRIGRNQAYRLAESGALGAIRLGNTWRVPRHRLEQLLGTDDGPGMAAVADAEARPLAGVIPRGASRS